MDWLYLALLAPFILVPVVLLFGYAGCGSFGADPADTTPGLNLTFEFDGTTVKLKWNAGPAGTVKYKLSRGPTGGDMGEVLPGPGSQTQYSDVGLAELTRYFYVVTALNGSNTAVASSKQVMVDIPPLPPTNLTATATGPTTVRLTWTNNPNTKLDRVVIRRSRNGTSDVAETDIARAVSHDDLTPSAATDYAYQVASRLKPAIDTDPVITSAFAPVPPKSVGTTAPPETFSLAFPATPKDSNRNSDNPGDCIIVRIGKELLQAGGNKVRITFPTIPGGLGFVSATISQPARSGNPYDAHSDLMRIGANIDTSKTQPTPFTVNYILDKTQDLLLAFDIKSATGFTIVPITDGVPGCVVYVRDNTQEANKNVRTGGYLTFNNTLAIVQKIEVA